ncbi:MAG: hypothetical protein Hens3KO_12360 [Henriciella sp.]
MLPMGAINVLASVLVALTMLSTFGAVKAGMWAAPLVLSGFLQIWSWSKFRNLPEPESVGGGFLRKSEYVAVFAGICWGSAPLIFNGSELHNHIMFLSMIQAGMAAGVVALISPLPRHTARFVVPCLIPTAITPFFVPGMFLVATGIMGVIFAIGLVNSSIDNYKQLKGTISKTWESYQSRNNMIDAIESTNDAFAFYDADGELVMANEQHNTLFGRDIDTDLLDSANAGVETIQHSGRWLIRARHETRLGGTVLVHTDITAIKMRERELVEARKDAVEADKSKSRFLSTMSHELRTPLNIILGFSRLMASDSQVKLSWDEVAEYSDSINESGRHLLHLIDDIIDYTKVGLDKYLLNATEVNLRELLSKTAKLAANFEHVSDMSNLDIKVSSKLGALVIDESVCQRIIMHLLTNALRFRGSDMRVIIRAGLNSDGCPFIAIRDFGIGIPEDELEKVFEAFYQHESGADRGYGGTGLGLTLCRHLARLQDGDIILKSRVGVGTTAMLVLPKSTHKQTPQSANHSLLPDYTENQEKAA